MRTTLNAILMGLLFAAECLCSPLQAAEQYSRQTVYVPIYSHIYTGDREKTFDLAVTLSIRNTDMENSIVVESADYFNTEGKLIQKYIDKEVSLAPMAATRYVVQESDKRGGSGASFVVKWRSANKVSPPVIQGVMIGSKSQQGISFLTEGQVIEETVGQ
ncbi:MAG: DUF3124 domain-containing protein [Proteobacteria bacterium]|nr:DUF3124 domain-containing protein [Pseudomonadota bacterium]MBU0968770.1 DUF3124 domain-containing protein [Pseudomonadota bacterium]